MEKFLKEDGLYTKNLLTRYIVFAAVYLIEVYILIWEKMDLMTGGTYQHVLKVTKHLQITDVL